METDPVKSCPAAAGFGWDPRARTPPAYLVIVRKGPTWNLADIEPFCRLLSERFAGEVWAFGSYSADAVVGRMRLRVVKERPLGVIVNRAKFTRRVIQWTEELRAARPQGLAIIALEPFTGGLLGLYVAWRAGGALICEINGVYSSSYNATHFRYQIVRRLRAFMRRLIGGFVLRNCAAVRLLFPDQLKGFVTLPKRVISRQFFERSELGLFQPGAEEPIILGVGFPFLVKGFDILCKAFLQISDRYPSVRLVLIGYRVPEELQAHGLEHPRIEAYRGLPHPQVAQWMTRCSIFALPSRTEGMGRVLLEAAAAGKCRIATAVDGIPTVIENGVDGVLVEPGNVAGLAEGLERLICDSDLRRRLGDAARLRVKREFSDQAYLDHYEDLVAAALHRERS